MASNGSSLVPADVYRHFFETFQSTVNVNDPLPVKVGSHSIYENEVDGEIVDWTLQYLQQKYVVTWMDFDLSIYWFIACFPSLCRNCPSKLLAHLVSLILWEVRFCISKDDVDAAGNRDKGDIKTILFWVLYSLSFLLQDSNPLSWCNWWHPRSIMFVLNFSTTKSLRACVPSFLSAIGPFILYLFMPSEMADGRWRIDM